MSYVSLVLSECNADVDAFNLPHSLRRHPASKKERSREGNQRDDPVYREKREAAFTTCVL